MKDFIKNINLSKMRTLFWDNTGTKQTIAKNTFWVAISELTINILKFTLLVYAARVLGDTGFGAFAFVSSFIAVFGIFFDMGLTEAITRELAKDATNEDHIPSLFSLKATLSVLAWILVFISSFFVKAEGVSVQIPVLLLSGYMFLANLQTFFYAIFRARERMQFEFLPNLLQNAAIAGVGFLLLRASPSVAGLTLAYLIGAGVALIPTFMYVHKTVSKLHFRIDKILWKKYLHISYPLALVGVVSVAIYNNVDSIMLGMYGQIEQNGWYSAAYRVLTFSLLPMVFISQSFFPALSRAGSHAKEKLQNLWNTQLQVFIFLSVPILFGGYSVAHALIMFLYPPAFAPAVPVFQILIGTVFFIYLYNPFRQILIVFNHQKKVFKVFFIGMLINIGLNILTIPTFSLYGSAMSTLVTQLFVLVGLVRLTMRETELHIMSRTTASVFSAALLASIFMFFVLHWLHNLLSIFYLLGAGVAVYIIAFLLFYFVIKGIFPKKSV